MAFSDIGAVASIAGAGLGAAGQLKGGQSNAAAANYQAAVAKLNAQMAEQQATQVTEAGEVSATTQSLKGADTAGKIKAAEAASDIDTKTGSAVNVQAGQREASRLDSATVLNNAQVKAYGYRVMSAQDTAQGQLDTLEASGATTGAGLGAAGTILGSAKNLPLGFLNGLGGGGGGSGEGNPGIGS